MSQTSGGPSGRQQSLGAKTRGRLAEHWESVKTIVYAVLIAMVVRTFAFEPFNIPSGSMIPTLLVGDYLFVSKFSYGYSRYSFPFDLAPIEGRIFASPPERGDVAVFRLPREPSVDYIKRIVGLPGDRLQVRGGVLYINGEPVPRQRIEDYVDENGVRSPQYLETLPNGRRYRVLDRNPHGALDNTPVYVVPEGHYFAMGDNRDNSLDSRVPNGVGFIPEENLIGPAQMIFYSTDGSAAWWEPWKWLGATRFDRLFRFIE